MISFEKIFMIQLLSYIIWNTMSFILLRQRKYLYIVTKPRK